jgi:dTMP kinase
VKRGKLIAFEGVDGSGKSTQIARLAAALKSRGRVVETTFEPTDGDTGRRIRAMARSGETVDPETELAWFLTDRREHVEQVIEPRLAAGAWVLTDRYTLSSVAYQGARGLSWEKILETSEVEFPLPDLALIFEIDVEVGMRRIGERQGVAEPAFENREFLEAAAAIFAVLDRDYIERIDAGGQPDDVCARMMEVIDRRL